MMPHSLAGPWISLKEVTDKTGLVTSEILYYSHTEQITPVIRMERVPLLLCSIQGGNIVGHATCRYTGPASLDKAIMRHLVSHDEMLLRLKEFNQFSLLSPHEAEEWSLQYPFQGELPSELLADWQPQLPMMPLTQPIEPSSFKLLILPEESIVERHGETVVELIPKRYDIEDFFARFGSRYLAKSSSHPFSYEVTWPHLLTHDELRFPKAAVDYLLALQQPETASSTASHSTPSQSKSTKKEIHHVIFRVLAAHPNDNSGLLWNHLRKDHLAPERQYDTDYLITHMTPDTIQWVSGAGNTQTFKKNTFKTFISRQRKVG